MHVHKWVGGPHRWLALSSLVLLMTLASAFGLPAHAETLAASRFWTSLTVLPPGPVTDNTDVEIRLAIRNIAQAPQTFDVWFEWKTAGAAIPIEHTSVTVDADGQGLATARFATRGNVGQGEVRYRVRGPIGNVKRGSWPLQIIHSETPALPLLQAAWIEPGAVITGVYPQDRPITEQDLRNAVDSMSAQGMDTLTIAYAEYVLNGWGAFYPSSNPELQPYPVDFDVIGTLLDQAEANGQHVFVGLGRGHDLYLTYNGCDDPERIRAALDWNQRMATELWRLYSHYESFYGWYLTHEAADIECANNYYNPLSDFLHSLSADKPTLVAPSGTPIVSPEVLRASHVDVFAYQDAVGAGYVPYVYTYQPELRIITLDDVYSSYHEAHEGTGKHLWTDLEIWQMDGPTYANPYPADFSRVKRQIDIESKYVEFVSAYAYLGFMENPNSTVRHGGDRAVKLYEDYRDYRSQYLRQIRMVEWLPPVAGDGSVSAARDTFSIEFKLRNGLRDLLTSAQPACLVVSGPGLDQPLRWDLNQSERTLHFDPASAQYSATVRLDASDLQRGVTYKASVHAANSGTPWGTVVFTIG